MVAAACAAIGQLTIHMSFVSCLIRGPSLEFFGIRDLGVPDIRGLFLVGPASKDDHVWVIIQGTYDFSIALAVSKVGCYDSG